MQFFVEGGWGMWPVLVFGLVSIGSAAHYAWDLEPVRLRFAAITTLLVGVSSLHAMLTNVASVLAFLQDRDAVSDAHLPRVLCTGLMESTRPGALGGIFVVLAIVLIAVGIQRDGQRQLRHEGTRS